MSHCDRKIHLQAGHCRTNGEHHVFARALRDRVFSSAFGAGHAEEKIMENSEVRIKNEKEPGRKLQRSFGGKESSYRTIYSYIYRDGQSWA